MNSIIVFCIGFGIGWVAGMIATLAVVLHIYENKNS